MCCQSNRKAQQRQSPALPLAGPTQSEQGLRKNSDKKQNPFHLVRHTPKLTPGEPNKQSRDGEVEEPHGSQPVVQGSQERDQETQEAPSLFHQRGMFFVMDPKFLRNQRYARKHNKKSGETATEEE
ncbi:hypothetical protein RHGRI_003209 [Rhododendron griersonianum]|uniref:Uncharacterized protein n=1 Tax=Rhododendron griersonianum TaxID=479676 RepID=A0AAV6L4M0_9ERIC|nr:hypothetical protein RHGRI_003209 [Rhododendron griersonianum]